MTVAELQSLLRSIDPSRTVVLAGTAKGKVRAVPVKVAGERILRHEGNAYVPVESMADGGQASVFVLEG